MKRNLRMFVAMAVTAVALLVVLSQFDISRIVSAIGQVGYGAIALAGLLLLLGAFLAVVRLWFIASDIGHRLSTRDTMLALGLGQLAGAATIQFFGQIAARSALLSDRGLSTPTNIAIAAYERLVAIAVSLLLAAGGGAYLFGQLALDVRGGGGTFLYLLAGIISASGAGAYFVWGETALANIRAHLNGRTITSLVRTAFITALIQLTTSAAYVVIAASLTPSIGIGPIFAASLVVMFAASLPISFAGWGIRELSAVLALTSIGMQAPAAVAVAALVGILALVSIVIVAATAAVLPPATSRVAASSKDAGSVNMEALVKWLLPIAAATAIFFQVHLPTSTRALSVNLADPLVILGAAVFCLYYVFPRRTQWRLRELNLWIALCTLAIIGAWANGYFRFGFSDWAFTNKGLGWFVLLAYGATGAMIVARFGKDGLLWMTRTFAFAAAGLVVLGMIMTILLQTWSDFPREVFGLPLSGFSQNRNAFAFMLLLAVATIPLHIERYRPWLLGVLVFGIQMTGSRAGLGCLGIMLVIAALGRAVRIVDLGKASVAVVAMFLLVGIPAVLSGKSPVAAFTGDYSMSTMQIGLTGGASDQERLASVYGAARLFSEHPVIGAGLGAYVAEQRGNPKETVHIIHSTALWLLAELGLIGFAVFAVPAVLVLIREGREMGDDPVSAFITLALIAFAVMSLAHEMLYQRAFWLLLGAGLAYVPAPSAPDGAKRRATDSTRAKI